MRGNQDLADRLAVVTGGGSGIGRSCVERLSRDGAAVLIADTDEEKGSKAAASLTEQGYRVAFRRADVSRGDECEALMEEAVRDFARPISILVTAAGILHAPGEGAEELVPVRDVDPKAWQRILEVNLTGTLTTVQAAIPHLAETSSSIVTIASGAASRPIAGRSAYCVSKAGVWMLTKVLALELAPDVRVNSVAPGYTSTAMTEGLFSSKFVTGTPPNVPLQRLAHPDEIASVVKFLASSDASFVTGKLLFVDGGVYD